VTARTTTLKGVDTGRYYVEALPSYYLDSGEPAGRWRGAGAAELGLHGEVDEDDFLQLMAGHDPGTGRDLGTKFIDRSARAYDITCSAPKSVSVLFALGEDIVRGQVLDAHDAAVDAVVDWIERHAHCRYRVNGTVNVVDAEGIAAATFRQHTSRTHDPQVHTHIVLANRVRSPDGRWLALDARTIKHDQRSLSALYHAGLRAELTRRLGVSWEEPANGIAEIRDVPEEVLAAFSARTVEVDARIEEKLDRFVDSFGRQPTPRERWRLEREAVTDSRPAKRSCDAVTLHQDWIDRVRMLGREPDPLVTNAVARVRGRPWVDEATRQDVIARALATLAEKQSTWRPAELVRELGAALPTDLATSVGELSPWLDQLADEVIAERCLDLSRPIPDGDRLRRDGRPITESAIDRAITLPAIVAEEERLLAQAEHRLAVRGEDNLAVTGADEGLTGVQLDVAAAVAGSHQVVLVVGPAGTGKTTALRPAVDQLRRDGRPVFGLAPSAAAAEVLAADTGVAADTLDKLLIEHRLDRPPDHRYDLPAGATLVLDESAMAPTPKLAELFDLADRRSWRLALIGDPLQFAAVGRSGMFGHLVETFGAIELGRVHRFADLWEREASLRLRRGDLSVVELYEQHGRLHGGTAAQMREAVVRGWWEATQRGQTVAMMAPTTETVVLLNQRAQGLRLDAGDIGAGRAIDVGPYKIHVGDAVATRQNARQLVTDRNLMVKNRDRWAVTAIHGDGGLTLVGHTGRVEVPPDYVQDHVELAYASTSHASQGRTVDRSFLFLDGGTNAAGIYVPMTRGRTSNDVFVVCQGEETPADVVTESLARSWIDRPAVARRAELAQANPEGSEGVAGATARRPLGPKVLRQLLERAHEIDRHRRRAEYEIRLCQRELRSLDHRRQTLDLSCRDLEARSARAQEVLAQHDRPLHRRSHRQELEAARTESQWLPRALAEARSELLELDAKEATLKDRLARANLDLQAQPELVGEQQTIGRRLDEDRRSRGTNRAAEPPDYVVDRLGPRPPAGQTAALWEDAAGQLMQHHTAFGVEGGAPLSRKPLPLDNDAYTASHRAATEAAARLDRALGRELEIAPPEQGLGLSL
jgi:conjugative relaxase-like TrwC/TraI family protein